MYRKKCTSSIYCTSSHVLQVCSGESPVPDRLRTGSHRGRVRRIAWQCPSQKQQIHKLQLEDSESTTLLYNPPVERLKPGSNVMLIEPYSL